MNEDILIIMCLYQPAIEQICSVFVNRGEGLAYPHNAPTVRMILECQCGYLSQDGWTLASGWGRAHWEGEISI